MFRAGLGAIAEPPELVLQAIIDALESGEFHAYPDKMAKQAGAAYQDFATNTFFSERKDVSDRHILAEEIQRLGLKGDDALTRLNKR